MESPASHRLRRGRVSEPGRAYLLTSTTKDRLPLFLDFQAARCLPPHFAQAEAEGSVLSLAWVIMPDHVHWLIELKNDTLATVMRRFKSRSRCSLYKMGKLKGQLWQAGYHDRAIRREEDLRSFARYVVANPVRAGLVSRAGDYSHWDAIWV
ncbi:transposase [Pseudomonas fakonensis]|uniref:Transposase n=1 Tax=Pseudomonas fakonensis TaxID=2842355 RepID=A0ABX8N740_9PSED|nr:transposase [Pseudomonas fakonensis]QXH51177.1 transposase [Pseudomonas fakonensis]